MLIIESGSGDPQAESYATATELVSYAEKYGRTIPATEAEQEALLRRSADAMNGMKWKGRKANSTQALAFPRSGAEVDGEIKPSTLIPRQIQYGQMALAVELYAIDLNPLSQRTGPVVRRRVEGVVDIQFGEIKNDTGYLMPVAPERPSKAQFVDYLSSKPVSAVRL